MERKLLSLERIQGEEWALQRNCFEQWRRQILWNMGYQAKEKVYQLERGETKSQELSLTDEQAALMDEIGFDKSVEVDGRKLRPSKSSRPKKVMKYSPLNGTIAGLVNASEEIEGKSEDPNDHSQQQAEPLSIGDNDDEQVVDENYNTNMDPSAVANSWGDSANAVSLLVDAIMNKESHTASSDPADGKQSGASGNEWSTT